MTSSLPRIRNFHIGVKEIQNKVIFLRKLLAGGSEHSFGIHVAKMAGMPPSVLERAEEMLQQLEGQRSADSRCQMTDDRSRKKISVIRQPSSGYQLSFIQLDDPLLQQIKEDILNTQINTLTPVEALMKLNEIKKLLEKK